MGLVAEVGVICTLALHGRGIGIGLAEEEIRLAPVEVALDFPILAPALEIQSLLVTLAAASSEDVRGFLLISAQTPNPDYSRR
jgi:hypothetical protein